MYFILYGILVFVAFFCQDNPALSEKSRKNHKLFFCVTGFILLALVLGLRHPSMGLDLRYGEMNGYIGSFEIISRLSWEDVFTIQLLNYERGFIVFNKIVSLFSDDPQFFLFVCAVLCTLPVAICLYKKSESPFISFLIYLGLPTFLMNYSGLRQALAVGICFYAVSLIHDKKWIKFILIVLLAGVLHRTAFLFLLAYPLYYLRVSKLFRIISIFAIPTVFVLRYPLFSLLSRLFKENAEVDNNNAITLFLVFTLIYIFCIFYTDYSEEQNGLMNLFFVACICQAFGGVYTNAMRVGYYFMVALVLLLPLLLKKMHEKIDKPIFTTAIILSFGIFGLYSIYTSVWAMSYPYHFFWEVL